MSIYTKPEDRYTKEQMIEAIDYMQQGYAISQLIYRIQCEPVPPEKEAEKRAAIDELLKKLRDRTK